MSKNFTKYMLPEDERQYMPVSYTHLDVYKRQGYGRSIRHSSL